MFGLDYRLIQHQQVAGNRGISEWMDVRGTNQMACVARVWTASCPSYAARSDSGEFGFIEKFITRQPLRAGQLAVHPMYTSGSGGCVKNAPVRVHAFSDSTLRIEFHAGTISNGTLCEWLTKICRCAMATPDQRAADHPLLAGPAAAPRRMERDSRSSPPQFSIDFRSRRSH